MNNKYKIFALIAILSMAFVSCEDYLDKNPESDLSEAQIYSDYERFKGVVDRITGLLHNYAYSQFDYGNEIGTYSDECQQAHTRWGYGRMVLDQVNTGNWLNSEAPGFAWRMAVGVGGDNQAAEFHFRKWRVEVPAECATGIRSANLAIQNIKALEKFPEESIYTPEELKNQLLGQAFLLRGWFYFNIIRDFGGMPNMQNAFDTDHNFDEERPEYWESSEWAVADLDSAIMYLPEKWDLPSDKGRVTKTTAKAIKAMILLYQASPNMTIPRSQSLGYNGTPEYDLDVARRAVDASVEALAGALSPVSRYRMYNADEYMDAFYVRRETEKYISDEAIFQAPNTRNAFNTPWGFSGLQTGTGFYLPWFDGMYDWCGYAVPTQNAVDWYETSDGWKLEDAEGNSTVWKTTDPYSNRDPRLKKFIFCHGDKMYLTNTVHPDLSEKGLGLTLDAREGQGNNLADNQFGMYFTGYYHAGKYRWPGNNKFDNEFDNNTYVQIWSFIRFAQLYLDLAEAANEVYGPTGAIPNSSSIDVSNAVDAINKVRERIGMPPVHPQYYGSKEQFRDYIREERARELFSEQHRWWDLKRWRIAKEVFAEGIWVANITDDGANGVNYGKKRSDFARVFENRQYWYPFPESDMFLFDVFEQNPGW